ncbi:late blight resistance homolog R1B-17 [Olea europaea subsp. europaea]|uniref:Late blight resistance homolog R1B-17 n=1 Tax=Olea europaea subsp. europaea TaxID=158383 RepID=A0A8S0SMY5_OLEEU|nr:late blight resistance homolog R1B-17 [Olea europaea subsp. europaea]
MSDAAVEFLLENLKQLLLYNANLILDVKGQVEFLYNDLSLFKAFLKDSTEKRNKNATLQELVKQIRDVVYEAEDTVDTFVAQAAVHKSRSSIERAFHIFDYPAKLRSVAKRIEDIRTKVKDIYEHKKFGFEALQDGDGSRKSKEKKAPIVEEDNVVGFEDEAEKVTNLLTGGSDELEVISIVGMPGLGKTTLAKMIYRDPKIEYEFYNRAWVYVSQEYSRKEVFLNIWGHFAKPSDEIYRMNEESIARELRAFLEKGKYLIVMDDVWTEDAWNDLKIAFPRNKKRSRILLTSRIRRVAVHANPTMEPHNLRFLTSDESWTLLRRKALGGEECPDELLQPGKHIARECGGLPLALVVIGGILLEKGTESYWWDKVAQSVDAYLSMDQEKRMDSFIALSFNHLPYHLRACFLYFGMFPEDFQIPVWKLVHLWIAEGFITQKEGMSLEDIAEEYLDDLVNRNLVMVGKRRSNGKVKTCHVHDMLHVFCKKQAAQENFFQEIKRFDRVTYSSSYPAMDMYRRLCIHSRILNYLSSKPSGPRVRSFLCFSSEEIVLQAEHISSIPGAFKLLRVLDAKPILFTRFPTDLTQVVHLRYLVLSSNFKILPAAISSLWNMQSLIVETSSRTLEIKGDIWKMIQLRHLKTNASTFLHGPLAKSRKRKDDSLINANLRTLSTICPESCTEDVFARAPNLKKLGIRGRLAKLLDTRGASSLFGSLGKLDYLEDLKLLNDVFPDPPSEGKLAGLPQRYNFPPKLKKLTLADTLLEWNQMATLGMLESLEILKLKDNAFKGDWWRPEDGGFRALKVLFIGKTDLVHWHASTHHFPRLRSLYLKHCSSLEEVPFSLADVSSLQLIDLYCTTKSAAASAQKIQKHKKKMKNEAEKQSTKRIVFKLSVYPPDQDQ